MPLFLTFAFALCSTLINSQRIFLENPQIISSCNRGMRSEVDYLVITGRVGPDFNSLLNHHWSTYIAVEMHTVGASDFWDYCTINIGNNGVNCGPHSIFSCYCNNFDSIAGFAHITINITAKVVLSEAMFRVKWLNSNGSFIYSDNTVTFPKTFNATNVELKLTINGKAVGQTQNACQGNVLATDISTIELCCYNSASPCFVQMTSPSFVVGIKSTCATYILMHCNTGLIVLNNSFSMCTMTDFERFELCTIRIGCLFGKDLTTPENKIIEKSPYTLLTGMLWCLLALTCLCGCQAGISKFKTGVWCHYVNCYQEEEIADYNFGDADTSTAVSFGRRANTETSEITNEDETATVTTAKVERKSYVSHLQLPGKGPSNPSMDDISSITSVNA